MRFHRIVEGLRARLHPHTAAASRLPTTSDHTVGPEYTSRNRPWMDGGIARFATLLVRTHNSEGPSYALARINAGTRSATESTSSPCAPSPSAILSQRISPMLVPKVLPP